MKLLSHYQWLFPTLLLAAFVQNYYDLSVLMSEGSLNLFMYEGPPVYKVIKDIIYAILFVIVFYHAYRVRRLPITLFSGLFFLLVVAMLIFSTVDNGALAGLIGLRWIFPFIIFVLMKDWIRLVEISLASYWMLFGILSCLALQVYQLFFMPPVFGEVFFGLSARTPGFFVAPNSAAFFANVSAACLMVFAPFRLKLHIYSVILAMVVSALAQSGTGMVASFLLALRLLCGRQYAIFWAIALVGVLVALPNLDFLTGRDSYVELSGGGRIDALSKIFDDSVLSVTNFGLYTNAANLLSASPEDQLAPDSLIASWVGNFGLLSTVAFLLFALYVRYDMRTVDWSRAMPCVLVFGVFSMTTIVFEAFPMNVFLALGVCSAQRLSRTLS